MANPEHLAILKQGVDVWNNWRNENNLTTPTPDLIGANLGKADLSQANLSTVYLSGADLSEANLRWANLRSTALNEANLRKVDLSGANLRGANMNDADLSLATLDKANLYEALLRKAKLRRVKLSGADLYRADLREADLYKADLNWAKLCFAALNEANLSKTDLSRADIRETDLREANLFKADLHEANLKFAKFNKANLRKASLYKADLSGAGLPGACLSAADLSEACLNEADLTEADLRGATLKGAKLRDAKLKRTNLTGADLRGVDFQRTLLISGKLNGADLSDCRIFGISAWDLELKETRQKDLIITQDNETEITVDNLEVAQFIYLLLKNEKIRHVIDTIGKKGVLILGRFTEERKTVLDAIRNKLRELGFVPMMFDFEKPTQRDFTETIKTLAGMSSFIIADITNPKSSPLELQATMPDYMIPFVPIIQEDEEPFSMFQDLKNKYGEWVLDPLEYDTAEGLLNVFDEAVVAPANEMGRFLELKKAEQIRTRHVKDYKKG